MRRLRVRETESRALYSRSSAIGILGLCKCSKWCKSQLTLGALVSSSVPTIFGVPQNVRSRPLKSQTFHRGFRSAQRVRSLSGLIRDCQSARVPQKSTAESLEGLYELQSTAIVCSIRRIQGRGRGPLLPLCTARVWAHRTKLGVTVISELRQHGGGCHRCLLPVHKSSQEPATVLLAACRTRLVRILAMQQLTCTPCPADAPQASTRPQLVSAAFARLLTGAVCLSLASSSEIPPRC